MRARTSLSLSSAPGLGLESLGVHGSGRPVLTLLSLLLLLLSVPLAHAVSSCEIAIRLHALTVSSNISKVGFPALISDRQNPTVFFRKTVNTRQTLNNQCYICHDQGHRTTSDTWEYDALTGDGPNLIAWSGSSTYHAETNGQTTVDCFATRTGPNSWSDPSCQTLSVFTPDVTFSNRTPSAYTLVLTREEEALITVPQGSAVRRVSESSSLEINL